MRQQDIYSNCAGMTRRHALSLGLGGFFGLGLTSTLRLRAESTRRPGPAGKPEKPKTSCILVWLDGGPTHYETFDPKPDAPKEIRGDFGTIPTRSGAGVHFSEHIPQLAKISDKFSVIRSIRHNHGNHGAGNHYMMTGAPTRIPVGCGAFVSFHPSMGSVTAHERGAPDGLPPYFSMPRMSRSGGPNFLGAKFAPFVVPDNPNSGSFQVRDVALPKGVARSRFDDRHELKRSIDQLPRIHDEASGDPVPALDEYYAQGYDLVTSPDAQKAFDIGLEPAKIRDAYGRNSFGQRALLARRLVEAGVPFVTVYEGGWDHHRQLFPTLKKRLPTIDQTLASLINDLDERGRLDTTMVLVLGEFGRTPKINKDGGRDHWSNAMSVLFAGCGTPGGVVVGSTDKQGYSALDNVYAPENFVSSVYTKLGIEPGKIFFTPQGRPVHLVSDDRVIPELFA